MKKHPQRHTVSNTHRTHTHTHAVIHPTHTHTLSAPPNSRPLLHLSTPPTGSAGCRGSRSHAPGTLRPQCPCLSGPFSARQHCRRPLHPHYGSRPCCGCGGDVGVFVLDLHEVPVFILPFFLVMLMHPPRIRYIPRLYPSIDSYVPQNQHPPPLSPSDACVTMGSFTRAPTRDGTRCRTSRS